MPERAWYWLKVGHKMIEISRCPSCGEAVQNAGPCEVCFQAVWLEWLARKSLSCDCPLCKGTDSPWLKPEPTDD